MEIKSVKIAKSKHNAIEIDGNPIVLEEFSLISQEKLVIELDNGQKFLINAVLLPIKNWRDLCEEER